MKTLVVFESMFGNTKAVAEGIAAGLATTGEVRVGSVDEIAPEDAASAELVVAGGPTQAFGLASSDARDALTKNPSLAGKSPLLPGKESLRDWLERLPDGSARVAAFDTRFDKPAWLTGSAAKTIAKKLGKKGYQLAGTQSFFVEHSDGPLAKGELERAVEWGRKLGAGVSSGPSGSR